MNKAKMYRTVLKLMEEGNYTSRAPEKFESLYKEAKNWGQSKSPKTMKIHVQNFMSRLRFSITSVI